MVALPVDDGRQRHPGQVARRGLDRPRRQAELGGGAAHRAQAGAVRAREAQLADARQAHLATPVPADHRQGGGAAVHLVQLADEGKPANTPVALDEVSRRRREGLGRLGGGLLLVADLDLARADLLLDADVGRQHLLGEVEGDAGHRLVVVPGDALVVKSWLGQAPLAQPEITFAGQQSFTQ